MLRCHRSKLRKRRVARLQGDRADRLPVGRRSVHGAICGLASLQGRTDRRHRPSDADAHCDGEVLIFISIQVSYLFFWLAVAINAIPLTQFSPDAGLWPTA